VFPHRLPICADTTDQPLGRRLGQRPRHDGLLRSPRRGEPAVGPLPGHHPHAVRAGRADVDDAGARLGRNVLARRAPGRRPRANSRRNPQSCSAPLTRALSSPQRRGLRQFTPDMVYVPPLNFMMMDSVWRYHRQGWTSLNSAAGFVGNRCNTRPHIDYDRAAPPVAVSRWQAPHTAKVSGRPGCHSR
jgi:hypothetical protein